MILFNFSEDTLTSIVATGAMKQGKQFDWMVTVDCDLKGMEPPDWAIFSREEGLSAEAIATIKTLVDGIRGFRMVQAHKGTKNCTA
jgi:hypothetical protein